MRGVVKSFAIIFMALVAAFPAFVTRADGSEQLGQPSIPIAEGSGVIAAGVGLWGGIGAMSSGDLTFTVPEGATVEQVLLYWAGREGFPNSGQEPATPPNRTTIQVNGVDVRGNKIGETNLAGPDDIVVAYRADITELDLVAPGSNTLTITGGPFVNYIHSGAGAIVIVDEGDDSAEIGVVDGVDSAFIRSTTPAQQVTTAQTFNFEPQDVNNRTAELTLLVSEVGERVAVGTPQKFRKSTIIVDVGGTVSRFPNVLQSLNGTSWDTHTLTVDVPAGASSLTVQINSGSPAPVPPGFGEFLGSAPAAFQWIAATLVVPESRAE